MCCQKVTFVSDPLKTKRKENNEENLKKISVENV